MARVALREKIVVGLMMEGVSWVSMVVIGWVVVYREIWKGRKDSWNGGIGTQMIYSTERWETRREMDSTFLIILF